MPPERINSGSARWLWRAQRVALRVAAKRTRRYRCRCGLDRLREFDRPGDQWRRCALSRSGPRVDRLIDMLQRPYQIEQSETPPSDQFADRDPPKQPFSQRVQLALHVLAPNNLTLRGDDLRFTPDSALGLGQHVDKPGCHTDRCAIEHNVAIDHRGGQTPGDGQHRIDIDIA